MHYYCTQTTKVFNEDTTIVLPKFYFFLYTIHEKNNKHNIYCNTTFLSFYFSKLFLLFPSTTV